MTKIPMTKNDTIKTSDTLPRQSHVLAWHSLHRGSAAGPCASTVYCPPHQAPSLPTLRLLWQRQDIFHLFLEASNATAALSTSPPAEIPSLRHRADTKITPDARGVSETRPSQRDLLSLQRPGSQRTRICRPDKRELTHQAQRIDVRVSVPIKIKKSPASVRFCDLGRGFATNIRLRHEMSRASLKIQKRIYRQ